jgi:hypothetical protein
MGISGNRAVVHGPAMIQTDPEPIEHIKSTADDCARGLHHQGRICVHLQNLRSSASKKMLTQTPTNP